MTNITPSSPNPFERIRKVNELGFDFWSSRDLARVLDYVAYVNFQQVIEKAKVACANSEQDVKDHFVDFNEMIELGKGARRKIKSVRLSRYACYLIIQNADPDKEIVARGQTYFAIQTRRQELSDQLLEDSQRLLLRNELAKHNKSLAGTAKEAGVIQPIDYATFQNHGYMGLYGGLTAKKIHRNKGLKKSQSILDHMGSTELAANLFRATQTEDKIKKERIIGKENANQTHQQVGAKVRQTIKDIGGELPEHLPTAVSVKKLTKKQKVLKKKPSNK